MKLRRRDRRPHRAVLVLAPLGGPRAQALLARLFGFVEPLGDREQLVVLDLEIVPGGEIVGDVEYRQRIVAEQEAEAHHRVVHFLDAGAGADEDQIPVGEREHLTFEMPDEAFEGITRNLYMVALAVVVAQVREVDMHRPAAGAVAVQPL